MSDTKERDKVIKTPPGAEDVDSSRRSITKVGLGAPVLMSIASQPVFGANCLSNALSGNLSDPDRGECSVGESVAGIQSMHYWGIIEPEVITLEETPLKRMTRVYNPNTDWPRTLRDLMDNGSRLQCLVLAAWINTTLTPGYMITESQLQGLLDGSIEVPYGMQLEDFLASTMRR